MPQNKKAETGKKANPFILVMPCDRYPESSQHIKNAWEKGLPDTFPMSDGSKSKINSRRGKSTRTYGEKIFGIDKGSLPASTVAKNRDEYPPAVFDYTNMAAYKKGIKRADKEGRNFKQKSGSWIPSVEVIKESDNKGSGSKVFGSQLGKKKNTITGEPIDEGDWVKVTIACKKKKPSGTKDGEWTDEMIVTKDSKSPKKCKGCQSKC